MPEQAAIAVASQVISHALFSDGGSTNQSEAAAQMQQDRADEMFDLWVSYYQPVELKALTEIANRAVYIPRFDAVMQRANAQVLYDSAKRRKQALMCIPVKCEGMRRSVAKETATMQARVVAHAMQSAKMGEDAKAYIKDEQRLHDRMVLNNIGMNMNTRTDSALAAAAALHQVAAARAQSAYASSSQALGQVANRGYEWYKTHSVEGMPAPQPYVPEADMSGLPEVGSAGITVGADTAITSGADTAIAAGADFTVMTAEASTAAFEASMVELAAMAI